MNGRSFSDNYSCCVLLAWVAPASSLLNRNNSRTSIFSLFLFVNNVYWNLWLWWLWWCIVHYNNIIVCNWKWLWSVHRLSWILTWHQRWLGIHAWSVGCISIHRRRLDVWSLRILRLTIVNWSLRHIWCGLSVRHLRIIWLDGNSTLRCICIQKGFLISHLLIKNI